MRSTRLVVVLTVIGTLAGCSTAAGPTGERELQLTVRLVNPMAAAAVTMNPSPRVSAVTTVEIQSVAFVLGGLKLETAALDATVDWLLDESVVVALDLSGTPILAFDTDVPPGIYKELEVSVDKLEVGNPAEEPLITTWSALAEASVLVEGVVTRDGVPEPFTFTAALDVDLELPFDSPITFTEDDDRVMLVSLLIDLDGWFAGAADMLDPTDPANQSAIEANIQRSVELHESS